MAKDKINMPMGTAGLTRYFDEYKSRISFKPGYVIVFSIITIILIIMLHFFMNGILGM